ncbi:MAG: outer membrane beta-barrel protein [Betaproteobacteria bacterium]|jgi:OOP family OmpA-OmpF porin|nr:outer membrane beta-barrel protein [Betaproteobacteria bacterium]
MTQQQHAARMTRRMPGGRPAGRTAFLTAALLLAGGAAWAQTTTAGGGWSLLPGTQSGYVGINVGKPDFDDVGCGSAAFPCSDPDARFHVYTGGLINGWLGAEIGYVYEGRADRGGGDVRAEGLNLSAVARLPIGAFNAFAKGGVTYGRVRVSADPASLVPTGSRRGWGPSYGAGVGWDFSPSSGLVLEWARHEYRFPGAGGRTDIDSMSLGYVHRF